MGSVLLIFFVDLCEIKSTQNFYSRDTMICPWCAGISLTQYVLSCFYLISCPFFPHHTEGRMWDSIQRRIQTHTQGDRMCPHDLLTWCRFQYSTIDSRLQRALSVYQVWKLELMMYKQSTTCLTSTKEPGELHKTFLLFLNNSLEDWNSKLDECTIYHGYI